MGYEQYLVQDRVLKSEEDVIKLQEQHSIINGIVNQFCVDDMLSDKTSFETFVDKYNGKFIGVELRREQRGKHDLTVEIVIRVKIIYLDTLLYDEVFENEQLITKEMILDSVHEVIQNKIKCYYAELNNTEDNF